MSLFEGLPGKNCRSNPYRLTAFPAIATKIKEKQIFIQFDTCKNINEYIYNVTRNKMKKLILLLILSFPVLVHAQPDTIRKKIITDLTRKLPREYISADTGRKLASFIKDKFEAGGYPTDLNIDEFTYEITQDLRAVSHDQHFFISSLSYNSEYSGSNPMRKSESIKSSRQQARSFKKSYKRSKNSFAKYKRRTSKDMFMYGRIKILPGNIGYLEFFNFDPTSYDKKANKDRISLASVMKFMKNTNSLIIDFRKNMGGNLRMAELFCSYFIQKENTYLLTSKSFIRYDHDSISVDSFYMDDSYSRSVEGSKYNKPLFILTSNMTFSSAELCTYLLKKLSGATIVGEKTRGGGNGHNGGYITDYYSAVIPCYQSYDKETNYSIEGKGIMPDVVVNAYNALDTATTLAKAKGGNDVSYIKSKAFKKMPVDHTGNLAALDLNDFAGNYRRVKIEAKGENLYLLYDNYPEEILIEAGTDTFKTTDSTTVKFLRDENKKIISLQVKRWDFPETYRKQAKEISSTQ